MLLLLRGKSKATEEFLITFAVATKCVPGKLRKLYD